MKEQQEKQYTIAIMLGDTQSDYSAEQLRSFYTCAERENVHIIFLMGPQMPQYCTDVLSGSMEGDYHYQFDTVYEYVHFTKPDAMIITYAALANLNGSEERREFLSRYLDIPYLLLGDTSDDFNIPYIMADNYKGMRSCMEHLTIEHGYRKIAFLSGPEKNRDANERLQAYYDVMKECGLSVENTMVTYGNYSEHVRKQVEYLLDKNPGLEAIVCANDNMAKCCYRVCEARNLIVGKDIAITGFDDVELARTVKPLLTSVSQNGFQSSYVALKNAISLCKERKMFAQRMPVALHRRESCGCAVGGTQPNISMNQKEMDRFILKATGDITTDLLSDIPYPMEREYYSNSIREFFQYIYKNIFLHKKAKLDKKHLMDILKELVAYRHVSNALLFERFSDLLRVLLHNTEGVREQEQLTAILNSIQKYINYANISNLEQEVVDSNRKAWFVPSFTRDLTTVVTEEGMQEALLQIMKRFQMMNVKSCYIYLFKETIIHEAGTPLVFPEEIYLNAWFTEEEMVCYGEKDRPRITTENGFSSFIQSSESVLLTAFVLFSGNKQYGVMLCEVDQVDISFMQICGIQFGSLLSYLELNGVEKEARKELQESLKVIQEQNHILSFVSEYDELSQLLNRRGFMEHAIHCCRQNAGRQAYLIFSDIDHLKEINDCFGHAAGDFAICSASHRLREVLPKEAIIARIGGDEFVSLVLSDETDFKTDIVKSFKEAGEKFNAESEKPYYVEFSVGIHEFYCSSETKLNELIQKSDELLYQAKASRRKSVKKS